MKKIFLLAAFIASYFVSAQFPPAGSFYIQNYTDTVIQYVIWRLDPLNVAGNCTPYLQSSNPVTGMSTLTYSPSPNVLSVDALYDGDINTSNVFNPAYPKTPLIDVWTLDSNYANPNILPLNPVPTAAISGSQWGGIKLGVQDHSGNNIGGYYSLGLFCGSPTVTSFTGVINGSYMIFGGATWVVLF